MEISRREKYKNINSNNNNQVNKSNKFIDIKLDLNSLNMFACYVVSENQTIRRSHLMSLRNLMSILNMEIYANDMDKIIRLNFIQKALEAKLVHGLSDPFLIVKYVNGGLTDTDVLDPNNLKYKLSSAEIEWVARTVADNLKYSFIFNEADHAINLFTRFKAADYVSRAAIVQEIEEFVDGLKTAFRRTRVESMCDATFSLRSGVFENTVHDAHSQLCNPSSSLRCGMQGLNTMTAGGYQSGRCYMYFGVSGGFKSGTLLSMAYQIKKYNKDIKTKDPTKIPCVVLLTQENTVRESVERLFNMSTVADDIRGFSADEVVDRLRNEGELYLSDESPIDIIIKYKPNGSIDTSYLYTLVEDLEDDGYECICLIQDYVKRMRSAYRQPDLRLELGEIVNEFKVFSAIKDIPLLTASQLNRDAVRTLDAGAEANKADMTRMLGRANVGESLLMIDNLDWSCIINIEYDAQGNKYLVFKLIKIRYANVDLEYFVQPFVADNGMKLVEDYYSPYPLFKTTLRDNPQDVMKNQSMPKSRFANTRQDIVDVIPSIKHDISREDNIFTISKYRQTKDVGIISDELPAHITPKPTHHQQMRNPVVYN